jgi:hypothetical protein
MLGVVYGHKSVFERRFSNYTHRLNCNWSGGRYTWLLCHLQTAIWSARNRVTQPHAGRGCSQAAFPWCTAAGSSPASETQGSRNECN